MREGRLDELLIENTIDKNPSLLHKLMQVSTFSYIEKRREIDYADAEYPLHIYRKKMNYSLNENSKKNLRIDDWNADLILLYNDGGKRICEIVEIETIKADELLYHRRKNILNKIKTVESAYNAHDINKIFEGTEEVRFSLALNGVHLNEKEKHMIARRISRNITQERNRSYKEEDVHLHSIYMLKDVLWDYCRDGKDKEFLMNYNLAMDKDAWKTPLKNVMTLLYADLSAEKTKAPYESYRFKNR